MREVFWRDGIGKIDRGRSLFYAVVTPGSRWAVGIGHVVGGHVGTWGAERWSDFIHLNYAHIRLYSFRRIAEYAATIPWPLLHSDIPTATGTGSGGVPEV